MLTSTMDLVMTASSKTSTTVTMHLVVGCVVLLYVSSVTIALGFSHPCQTDSAITTMCCRKSFSSIISTSLDTAKCSWYGTFITPLPSVGPQV